jgi:hypothetical protein
MAQITIHDLSSQAVMVELNQAEYDRINGGWRIPFIPPMPKRERSAFRDCSFSDSFLLMPIRSLFGCF